MRAEKPPTLAESFRIGWSVRTLRYVSFGLPFIIGSITVVTPLIVTLLDEKYGLGPGARGFFGSAMCPPVEPYLQVAG